MSEEIKVERYLIIKDKNGHEVAVDNPEYFKILQKEKYDLFLKQSNIPEFYYNISFDDYFGQKSNEEIRKIRYYAEHCHEERFKYVSLYLWGKCSTQKSSLACNIGKYAIKKGLRVKFVDSGELIDKLLKISSYNRDFKIEEEIANLKEHDLIILDDMGKGVMFKSSPDLVINAWDNFLRPLLANGTKIIFTSNNSLDLIKDMFGEGLMELLDRNCEVIQLTESVKPKRKLSVSDIFKDV